MKGAEKDSRDTGFSRGGGGGKVTGREGRVLPLGRGGRERRRRQEAGGVQVGSRVVQEGWEEARMAVVLKTQEER